MVLIRMSQQVKWLHPETDTFEKIKKHMGDKTLTLRDVLYSQQNPRCVKSASSIAELLGLAFDREHSDAEAEEEKQEDEWLEEDQHNLEALLTVRFHTVRQTCKQSKRYTL